MHLVPKDEASLACYLAAGFISDALRTQCSQVIAKAPSGWFDAEAVSHIAPPAALRALEAEGRLEARRNDLGKPASWRLTEEAPHSRWDDQSAAQAVEGLAARWLGSASARMLATWSGLAAGLFHSPPTHHVTTVQPNTARLLPNTDPLLDLIRPSSLLADTQEWDDELLQALLVSEGFPLHVVLLNGEWVGVWEWDPEDGEVVVCPCRSLDNAEIAAIGEAAGDLGAFVVSHLGGRIAPGPDDDPNAAQKRLDKVLALAWA